MDEANLLALRHHPETVVSWGDQRGFGLLIGASLSLVVAPDHRGAGLGTALLTAADEAGILPAECEAWSHGSHPAAAVLAERFGFIHDRSLWKMARGADAPALSEWTLPEDVTLRPYQPGDAEALLAVNASAFASHPDQGAMSGDDLAERMAEPWFDPAGLLLACADTDAGFGTGELLGFHWTKRHSDSEGEVYVLGVSPEAQGTGLGRALLEAGLEHLASVGCTSVHLYVEANNAPAIALYGSLGFRPVETHAHYVKAAQA